MAASNKWNRVGEDIMNSVLDAVESGDFTGLSQCVGDVINRAADGLGRGMNRVGREVERQTREYTQTARQQIYEQQARMRREYYANAENQDRNGNGSTVYTAAAQPPARYRRYLPGQAAGPVCLLLGIVGTSIFGSLTIVLGLKGLFGGSSAWSIVSAICAAVAIPCIALITKGAGLTGRNSRFRRYVREIGNRGYCRIEDLAHAVGKRTSFVQKDLQKMLQKGYFLQGHMDAAQTTLIVDQETYKQYEQAEESRRLREQQEAASAQVQAQCPEEVRKILAEGEAYIDHIHECNDAIPGEVMSAKLAKLEDIMRRIFAQVEKQPDSAQDLHKMMTYYLPTTTKLIDAYRDLDGQPEYGANVANTKKEIEDTLDTINEAFENLFDSLFEDTAWDISSDISTMKVMLQQEGLTKNTDFTTDTRS